MSGNRLKELGVLLGANSTLGGSTEEDVLGSSLARVSVIIPEALRRLLSIE